MTHRLAHSRSLYLRKHAENPVDWWWPWIDEALERAERDNKLVFGSIWLLYLPLVHGDGGGGLF